MYFLNKPRILQERLVTATKDLLDKSMKDDEDFAKFMTTPIIQLQKNYSYLVATTSDKVDLNDTLYNEVLYCLEWYTEAKFSMVGNKIVGFTAYILNHFPPFEVFDIAMFSCDPKSNGAVLMRDMLNLIKDLQKKYATIQWMAIKGNPANRIYQALIKKENGRYGEHEKYKNILVYRLPGRMPLPENLKFSEETGMWYG